MIAKIKRGNGFRGVLDYALNKEKGHLIGGNMLGQSTRELSSEFRLTREMAPATKNPVWHCSLALPSGESLDNSQWQSVVERYTKSLGFSEDHQYCIVKHTDTDHNHVHIIASRISYTGELYGGQNDGRKSQKILPEFEKEYRLTIVNREKAQKKTLTRTEREKSARLGEPAPRKALQDILSALMIKEIHSNESFVNNLKKHKITAIFNKTKSGDIRGVSFEYQGLTFKGSSLGKNYSWNKIKKQILGIDNERINELIGGAKQANRAVGEDRNRKQEPNHEIRVQATRDRELGKEYDRNLEQGIRRIRKRQRINSINRSTAAIERIRVESSGFKSLYSEVINDIKRGIKDAKSRIRKTIRSNKWNGLKKTAENLWIDWNRSPATGEPWWKSASRSKDLEIFESLKFQLKEYENKKELPSNSEIITSQDQYKKMGIIANLNFEMSKKIEELRASVEKYNKKDPLLASISNLQKEALEIKDRFLSDAGEVLEKMEKMEKEEQEQERKKRIDAFSKIKMKQSENIAPTPRKNKSHGGGLSM